MATAFDHLMNSPQTAVGKGTVGDPPRQPGRVGVKVKAAIFFDGTGNNQSNITKRLRNPSYMRPRFYQADSDYASYEQYYSNVATLYFMHVLNVPGEQIASVYMEGIGTTNDGADDTSGGGFGAGPTGIVARVNRGISDLSSQIRNRVRRVGRGAYLEELTVYAFGFSRGAAAARHFCARRTERRGGRNSLCQELGVASTVVKLKFVGLFDTVSSYDATDERTPAEPSNTGYVAKALRHLPIRQGDSQFRNDVAELHLNLDDPTLERVVHLVAGDEYRLNLTSTTIDSALQRGVGYELKLPGAHSDIGGGYPASTPEVRVYDTNPLRQAAQYFRSRGWYTPTQLTEVTVYRGGSDSRRGYPVRVITGRRQVPNSYQYVSLSIMRRLSRRANSGIQFGSPNQGSERDIHYIIRPGTPLANIKSQLETYALANFSGQTRTLVAPLSTPQYHWLRNNYLHLSWSDRLGFEFRTGRDGLPTRLTLPG